MKERSRVYNVLKNIFLGVGNQVIVLLMTFITRMVFVRTLGVEYLGINGLFANIITILSVAELGLGSSIIYSMYKPLSENNMTKISALMNFYKKIYNIIAIVIFVIGVAIIPFLKYLINYDNEINNINLYYLLFLINTVVSYLLASRSVILNADQKLYITKIYTLLVSILQCILQIIILIYTKNFILYLIIQILCTFLTNVCGLITTKKLYPYLNEKDKLSKKDKKSIFKNMKSMFIYKIGGVVLNNTDNILISVIAGTKWVGYYSNYYMVISAIETFTNIVFSSLTASIGNLVAKTDKKKQYEIFNVINCIYNIVFGIGTVVLFIVINDFIRIAFGENYILGLDIVSAIVILFYIKGILTPIWMYRETTGLFESTKYIIIVTAILNIVLSILLGNSLGMFGILLATSIARIFTNIWYEPYILHKLHFKNSVRSYFEKNLKNIIFTIIIGILCYYFTINIKVYNILYFVIKTIIVTIITIILYYVLYRNTEEIKYLKSNVLDKILSKFRKKIC